jgi:hypothetical protein
LLLFRSWSFAAIAISTHWSSAILTSITKEQAVLDTLELYKSLDERLLRSWVDLRQEENLHLDYKTLQREEFTHGDDKKNLAKALSGFANSDGGLIVWGVDGRRNDDGVDCASGFALIRDPSRVLARLNEFTGEFVTPRVDGVQHRGIPFAEGGSCIVSYVPTSDSAPHMAKGGEGRYYKRSGSSFYAMEHFDLEDMFGRRKKPRLQLSFRFEGRGGSFSGRSGWHNSALILRLSNTGRAIAKAPYFSFTVKPPFTVDPFAVSGLPRRAPSLPGVHQYGASSEYVVHAGVTIDVAEIGYRIGIEDDKKLLPPPLEIVFEMAAEDMPLKTETLTLSSEELLHARFPDGEVPNRP